MNFRFISAFLVGIATFSAYGQSEGLFFFWPENQPEILIGKTLTPTPKSENLQQYGYSGFYKLNKRNLWVGYDDSQSKYDSERGKVNYSVIVGKKFLLDRVELDTENTSERISGKKYWFYMTDVESNESVRYYYESKYEFNFHLSLTEEFELPEDWFCRDFTIDRDKFSGDTRIYTDFSGSIHFSKIITGENVSYYMSLQVGGSTLNTNENGVYLILDNGEVLSFPNEPIDTKVNTNKYGGDWLYTAYVKMSDELLNKLSNHYITDIRLYIYDTSPSVDYAKERMMKLVCLINDKLNVYGE